MKMRELGAALGPGWEWFSGYGRWTAIAGHTVLEVSPGARGTWVVSTRNSLDSSSYDWRCSDAERAVNVARLLLGAARVQSGAEVAQDRRPDYAAAHHDRVHGPMVVLANGSLTSPACARRDALDLLAAAEEAERVR